MSTRSAALRNTMFSSVGIYTEYFLGMLTSIIIARHLGPSDFGAYSLVIWLVATGVAVTNSGVSSAAIKFVAELRGAGQEDRIRALLAWTTRLQWMFLAVVLAVGVGLFALYGQRVMPGVDHAVLLAILVTATVLRAQYMLNISVAKGFENFRATAVVAATVAPINLVLVLAAWLLHGPVEWFLGAFALSSLAFWWISRRQVARLLPPADTVVQLDAGMRLRLRNYTALVAVTVAVTFITASEVEVLFLTLYDSAAAAGHFKVGFQLSSGAILLVPGVFGALLLPMMANALSQGREVAGRRMSLSTSYLMALAAPLVAFGVVFAKPIIGLLYGPAYAPAAFAFAVCLAAGAVNVLSQGASSYLLGAERQRALLGIVVACSVAKIALDVVLIQRYGLTGAVVAFSATTVLSAVLFIALALRYSGARLQWLRMGRAVLAAGLAGLAAWGLQGPWPALPTLAVGGTVVALVYAASTLLLGFWSIDDIHHFQQLHQRFARGRPRLLARMLEWAARRAEAIA